MQQFSSFFLSQFTKQTNKLYGTKSSIHFMETHNKRPSAGDGDDNVLALLLMEEAELLNHLLDSHTHTHSDENDNLEAARGNKVTFIDDPYSSLLLFQSSSSYITINGNEESCGSSFSDSGTSLMASLHTVTTFNINLNPNPEDTSTSTRRHQGSLSGVLDGCHWDDQVLATFLGENQNQNE